MATESEWSCPICCDDQEDVAYLSPCLHQFCLGCALRWAWQKPNCPLCRLVTTAILFSVRSDDDFLTFDVPGPAEPPADHDQDEQGAAGPVPGAQVGGFGPETWADFFKSHPNNIRPLLPWLRRELGVLFEEQRWEVAAAEGTVVAYLCLWGLDEEVLVRELQGYLQGQTQTFVRRLIAAAVHLCGRELRRHLGQQGPRVARGEDDGPAASPSPTASWRGTPAPHLASSSSPAGSDIEDRPSTSAAALRGGPGCPPSAPLAAEQEQPQEEPGEVVVAGPSAQGCSRSPSTHGQGRDRPPRGPRRPPKRKSSGPQDSARPCKRPPRRQH
ncbi:TOPRS ligase, partial [Fregata magnificens]|nr:TOPRS ligase [Fregata magnificens]